VLYGGCYCSEIRYSIIIPPLAERPVLLPAEKNTKENVDVRPPIFNLDHCNDCRKAGANLVPGWVICPQSWVKWSVRVSKEPLPVPKGCLEGRDVRGGERTDITTEEMVQRPSSLEGIFTFYQSSPEAWRTFCTKCGTNLSFVCLTERGSGAAPTIDVTFGSLDRESLEQPGVRPDRHFWYNRGIEWVQKVITDGDTILGQGRALPRHPEGTRLQTM
jgi:hypothetical protein